MKRIITIVGIMALVGVLAAPALAYGPRRGGGDQMVGPWGGGKVNCPAYGRGWYGDSISGITVEQRAELDNLHQKFFDETAQVRTDLFAKRGALRTLLQTSNPDEAKALTLQKEISDLKGKMAEAKIKYLFEARKIHPDARIGWGGHGRGGYGRHMKGFGPGGGPARTGGGYGPRNCWN